MRRLIASLTCLLLSLPSWGATHPRGYEALAQQYVQQHVALARKYAAPRGIPVSICLAQAMHESGLGQSKLAIHANNHFGIKAHNEKVWKGEKYYLEDDDFNAEGVRIRSAFRKYASVEESYQDYAHYLCSNARYARLFSLPKTDYRAWAYELLRAGYASDSTYAKRLIDKIEKFELYRYDDAQLVPESSDDDTKAEFSLLFSKSNVSDTAAKPTQVRTEPHPNVKRKPQSGHTSNAGADMVMYNPRRNMVSHPPCPTPPQRLDVQTISPIFMPITLKTR